MCSRAVEWEGMSKKISSPFAAFAVGESISEPTSDRSGPLGKTSRLEWVISAVWTRVPLPVSKPGTNLASADQLHAKGTSSAETWEATTQ